MSSGRAEFVKTVVLAAPGKPIQPFPEMPASMVQNPTNRDERSGWWMAMQEWRKALEDRLKDLESKFSQAATTTTPAATPAVDANYYIIRMNGIQAELDALESTVAGMVAVTSGPNWRFHPITRQLQVKDLASGLYHTIEVSGGVTLNLGAGEA